MSVIKNQIKSFFASKFNIYLFVFLIFLGISTYFFIANQDTTSQIIQDENKFKVYLFFLPTCPHCTEQKPIYEEVKKEFPEIAFYYYDASTSEGSSLFYKMAKEAEIDTSNLGVPTIFVGKKALVGVHSKEQIKEAINECLISCETGQVPSENTNVQEENTKLKEYNLPFFGKTDLTSISLPVLAITLGLIDGFNPCAMWVLVYLISLLIGVGDKKKIWLIVGSFVFASGVLYFLFMTAWINIFLLVGYIKILTLAIGLVALGGGILNLKDYYLSKCALTCNVGDDSSHEKLTNRIQDIIKKPISIAVIFSIIALAFIVNSVEFVCSSAIPAVFTQILALNQLTAIENYSYIGLYTLAFMLDDLLIFGMAAFAIGSTFGNKYAKYCKLIGGILLVVLGAIMVFAPHLLR